MTTSGPVTDESRPDRPGRTGALRILVIGGTGTISSACVPRVLAAGHRLTVLNRGATTARPIPAGVEVLRADAHDPAALRSAIGSRNFDVVMNCVAYTADHVESDIELFSGRIGQYVFISSAAVYRRPIRRPPVTESTPLENPFWQYGRDKIACEQALLRAYRDTGFPVTIARPAQTYDRLSALVQGGWTQIERMRRGLEAVVHGDGTSLWTITHSADVARGLVGLLGHRRAVGEAYNVTGDDVLTWNQIFTILAEAAGVQPRLVHVTSEQIAAELPAWGANLLGSRAHSMIFDNAKIKAAVPDFATTVPFEQGAREIIAWRDADPARRFVDERVDTHIERLIRLVR